MAQKGMLIETTKKNTNSHRPDKYNHNHGFAGYVAERAAEQFCHA